VADDHPYLLHIRDAIDRIRSYTHQGKEAFFTSSLLQDAVIRNLEVIGEAAKRISPSTKAQAAEIPWPLVADRACATFSSTATSALTWRSCGRSWTSACPSSLKSWIACWLRSPPWACGSSHGIATVISYENLSPSR